MEIMGVAKETTERLDSVVDELCKYGPEKAIASLYSAIMGIIRIPESAHSLETPERVARMMVNETMGYYLYNRPEMTTFPADEFNKGQVVIVKGIKFYSLCAHHHVPYFGTVDFAYVIKDRVVGLSKIPRLIEFLAKKPTVQEDLGREILDVFYDEIEPMAAGLIITADHLCMSMRGVKTQDTKTVTQNFVGDPTQNIKFRDILNALKG